MPLSGVNKVRHCDWLHERVAGLQLVFSLTCAVILLLCFPRYDSHLLASGTAAALVFSSSLRRAIRRRSGSRAAALNPELISLARLGLRHHPANLFNNGAEDVLCAERGVCRHLGPIWIDKPYYQLGMIDDGNSPAAAYTNVQA